jgi:hypothetical protein
MSTNNSKKTRKDDIKGYNKEYYDNNKDKYKEKTICDCGEEYKKYAKSAHEKTLKHKNKMMEKEILRLKKIENTDNSEMIKTLDKQQKDIAKKLNLLKNLEKMKDFCN